MQVEKADVMINLPGVIRFLLAHFRDVPLLKEYLEICKCFDFTTDSARLRRGHITSLVYLSFFCDASSFFLFPALQLWAGASWWST
jgi:hypothetical protein